jgi:hypothetical protein
MGTGIDEHRASTTLSEADFDRMVDMLDHVDSVELKLTVPAAEQRAVVNALGFDPLEARIREVFFFDTPDLALYHAGVVVRARRTQGRLDDSTVKLRPVVPNDMPGALRKQADFVIELDAMPGGFVCSGSYKGQLDNVAVREVLAFGRPLRKLYSKQQRAFYDAHAPDGLALDDLTLLGPITVFRLNTVPEGFGRKLVGELWLYPDGTRVIELSTKCKPGRAFDVAAHARAYLSERGIDLSAEQHTKTRSALEYFAAIVRSADATDESS